MFRVLGKMILRCHSMLRTASTKLFGKWVRRFPGFQRLPADTATSVAPTKWQGIIHTPVPVLAEPVLSEIARLAQEKKPGRRLSRWERRELL